MRTHLQQAAEGDLLCAGAAAAVRDRAALRYADPAAVDPAAEDLVQHRGLGKTAVPGAGSLEDGAAGAARVDARTREPADHSEGDSRARSGCPDDPEPGAADSANRGARGGRRVRGGGGIGWPGGVARGGAARRFAAGHGDCGRGAVAVRIDLAGAVPTLPVARLAAAVRRRATPALAQTKIEAARRMRI